MTFAPAQLLQWFRGTVLVGLADRIPDGSFRLTHNIRIDRVLGAICNRPGWTLLGTPSSSALQWVSKLFGAGTDYGYAQDGTTLYRCTSNFGSPSSLSSPGSQVVSSANFVDGKGGIWKYIVNGTIAIKDNGTLSRLIGIAAPSAAPLSAVLAADLSTSIDTFETSAASWTGANLASGPADDVATFVQGSGSMTFEVAASTLGSLTRTVGPLNLDTLTNGDNTVKDDDYIHIWVRVDRPERLDYMQLDLDLVAGTLFAADYYTITLPAATRLNLGRDVWNKVQVRKNEFQRSGTAAVDWSAVRGVRMSFRTNNLGTVRIFVDDLKLRGGVGIEGEIAYTATYKNSVTGGRGNPPKNSDGAVLYTTPLLVDRQRVTVTLTNIDNPGSQIDGQIDTIQIWRRGGNFSSAILVDEIADITGSFTDNFSDSTLALVPTLLETDNDTPPTGSSRVIFGPDATGHLFMIVNGHRLYICKPFEADENRADNWPADGFALIGDGSQRAITGLCTDTETFVWTESQTYQVLGAGSETFLPQPIPDSREIVGQYACTAGAGRVAFVANDGIYEQRGIQQRKLTAAIDPFFNGQTIDGHPPLSRDPAARATIQLAFYPDPQGDCFVMCYPETGQSTPNRSLMLKRNLETGEFTECFFDSSALTTLRALYLDTESNILIAGGGNGSVYQIEDYDVSTDNGTAIPIQARTKSLDFGQPGANKKLSQVEIEGDTNSAALTVTAYYNRAATSEALGTFQTTAATESDHLDTSNSQARFKDCAFDITGSISALTTIARLSPAYALTPQPAIFLDSDIMSFAEIQQLKWIDIDLFAPNANVTVSVYVVNVLKDSRPIFAHAEQRGVRHYLPHSLKGYNFRVTLSSTAPFELWNAVAFMKPLGGVHGYQPRELQFAK